MKILLDTNILVWAAQDILPKKAYDIINNKNNVLIFSTISIYEVVLKRGKDPANFIIDPILFYNNLLNCGYEELNVTGRHALLVSVLPFIHKDPFDRLIVAQAISEGLPLLTSDKILTEYHNSIIYTGR